MARLQGPRQAADYRALSRALRLRAPAAVPGCQPRGGLPPAVLRPPSVSARARGAAAAPALGAPSLTAAPYRRLAQFGPGPAAFAAPGPSRVLRRGRSTGPTQRSPAASAARPAPRPPPFRTAGAAHACLLASIVRNRRDRALEQPGFPHSA